ncbi:MAG: hypothetical protein GYA17_16155 [Chloroflexi bacterium]|nr:PucR family transcriptional regulator ligand-binding domain-containing protein [Anaerolineaceae bacterium]NMB89891.1 hypothetical protein [Chloroflexota bacterium]
MKLTVRELLGMDMLQKARLIAGEKGLDREILSVNVMEVPDIDNWVHPGELLITTMYPLRDQRAKIETLIPRLCRKELAGIAVKLHRYIVEIPESVIQQANGLGFPIIEIPSDISFIDLIQPVTSRILELQTNELLRSETIHNQFLDLVLNGGGFAEIASALARMVSCAVTIADRFHMVLGSSGAGGREHPHMAFIETDIRGSTYLADHFAPQLSANQTPSRKVIFMEVEDGARTLPLLVCPVKVGDLEFGRIIVWGKPAAGLDSMDLIAIEHASTIAALKMMEARSIRQVEQRFHNDIFEELLSDNPTVQAQALQNARQAGIEFPTPFLVVIMGADINHHRSLTTAEESRLDESLYMARRYVQGYNPHAVFWSHGARMVIFFSADGNDTAAVHRRVRDCLETVRGLLKSQSGSLPISAGVSDVFTEIRGFRLAYEQARQSLEIGQAMAEEEQGVIRHYSDLGFFRVIDFSSGRANLVRFCQDTLGTLIAYDRQHGTELIATLRVYLRCNQNATRAARALFIHYNTLRYRLDCITDILGNALDQPEQRMAIEMALYLYPLVNLSGSILAGSEPAD